MPFSASKPSSALLGLVVAGLLSGGAATAADSLSGRLTDVRPITVAYGAHMIDGFADDGRPALITRGWRDNGNAHGFDVWLILLAGAPGADDWNVVGLDNGARVEPVITDDPHTGEDTVRSMRLVKARLDGHPATLLITATRQLAPGHAIPDPAKTEIDIYTLRRNNEGPGETRDYFGAAAQTLTDQAYCNADMALWRELRLPLPKDYAGGRSSGGC
jgi:hypothetical protein